jgi:Chloride channel protein EriC
MKWVEYVKIIGFCILAACVYGVAHDLVTAHVCVDYFLPPIHPIIVPTDSPLLLALIWGVIATWWVGLFLGILLAISCRIGNKPKLSVSQIVRPVLYLLISLFIASMFFGLIGYAVGWMDLLENLPDNPEPGLRHKQSAFLFDVAAHIAAYLLGAIGGVIVTAYSIWCRFVASPRRVVLRWVEFFNKANASDLAELYHDNAVNHQIANEPVEGKENIRDMFEREFAAAEMVCIIENLFEDGEWAILEWKDPLGLRGCGFFHVTDRKIKFQRGYWDKLSFLKQHGLPISAE